MHTITVVTALISKMIKINLMNLSNIVMIIALLFLYATPSNAFSILHRLSRTNVRNPSSISESDGSRGDFFDQLPEKSQKKDLDRTQIFSQSSTDPEAHIPRLNIVTLVGRIGQTPVPKYFDDGKVVVSVSLAVKRKYHPLERKVKKIKYGEEETDWFNLELWGRDAEYAAKYVTKGARVGITGSLASNSWVDRNTGDKRQSFKVVVKHLDILESKAEADMRIGDDTKAKYGGRNNYYDSDDEDRDPSSGGNGSFFDS